MSVKASADTLKGIPLFADCDAVHLQVLAFSAPRMQFEAGSSIVRQGYSGGGQLILSGSVALQRDEGDGVQIIGHAGPGAFLGEIAMISGRPFALTALAETDVETMRLDKELLFRVAEEYPEFGARIFRALSRRVDAAVSDLGDAKTVFDRARSFSNL